MNSQENNVRLVFHQIPINNRIFVLDVGTSSVFEFDAPALEVLQALAQPLNSDATELLAGNGTAVSEAFHELRGLISDGFFKPDQMPAQPMPYAGVPRELHLALTYRCTLRCRYCYAHSEAAGADDHHQLDMPQEVVEAALDWAMNSFAAQSDTLNIWTGTTGETLLQPRALEYVKEQAAKLAASSGKTITPVVHTTNFTLSDRAEIYAQFADKDNWWRVSIDGPKHIHDAIRQFPDGTGSYDKIAPMLKQLLADKERADRYKAAATITGKFPQITEIFTHLYELGFNTIILRPVRLAADHPLAINTQTIGAVKQGYSDFVEFLLSQNSEMLLKYLKCIWHSFDYFGRLMVRVVARTRAPYRCGAGKWIAGVDTNGDIYPCGPMIGLAAAKMGNVFTGVNKAIQRLYDEDLLVNRKPGCKECWARYLCGGGCYVSAFLAHQHAETPNPWDCELMRHLLELAIYLVSRLREEHPTLLPALYNWSKERDIIHEGSYMSMQHKQ